VVDDSNGLYHVSGHANRPDIKVMHALVNPQMVIPMHGEHRHLREHCKVAGESGTTSLICVNGMMAEISGNEPRIVDYIDTGRVYLDGRVQYGAMDGVVRDRIRMALNGIVIVNIVMDDEDDLLGEPWIELRGLPEMGCSDAALADILEEDLSQYLGRAGPKTLRDDDAIEAGLIKTARQSCLSEIGKKPEVSVIISRIS
jgi:ribonuclease J